jgi:hypothetical protein
MTADPSQFHRQQTNGPIYVFLKDFIAEVKDDRMFKAAAAAAHNFR